jgi:hypothetical protein
MINLLQYIAMKNKKTKTKTVTDGLKTYQKTATFGNRELKIINKSHKAYKRNAKHRENLLAYA